MNYLKPNFVIPQADFALVWFEVSNQFLLAQDNLKEFFTSSVSQTQLQYNLSIEELIKTHPEIESLLEAVTIDNTNYFDSDFSNFDYKDLILQNFESSTLTLSHSKVSIYYSSEELQTLFQAPYKHLKNNNTKSDKDLIILEKDKKLILLNGKNHIYTTTKDQFFVLQAQFANQLTAFYHNIKNPSWLCSFHGCAVRKQNRTLLFLGDSGVGKSSLSSLLSLSDYRFIADDLVLMDQNFKIYENPAAVSVKETAWSVLTHYFSDFSSIKTSEKTKGNVNMKFLPLHTLQKNTPKIFEVDALVWVNFSKNLTNRLVPLCKKEALSRLIPDTWINSKLSHAKAFANWAVKIKTFQIDYSDFKAAKKLLDNHFQ